MTCAKQVVSAVIVATNGKVYPGENHARYPQAMCPRGDMPSGVGYHLCRDVCGQDGHAEIEALRRAGEDAKGAKLYLFGHVKCCPDCTRACDEAGIAEIVIAG